MCPHHLMSGEPRAKTQCDWSPVMRSLQTRGQEMNDNHQIGRQTVSHCSEQTLARRPGHVTQQGGTMARSVLLFNCLQLTLLKVAVAVVAIAWNGSCDELYDQRWDGRENKLWPHLQGESLPSTDLLVTCHVSRSGPRCNV